MIRKGLIKEARELLDDGIGMAGCLHPDIIIAEKRRRENIAHEIIAILKATRSFVRQLPGRPKRSK